MPLRGIAEAPLEALFGEDNEAICGALRARKVQSVKELAYVAAWELKDWLLIPEPEAEAILARSWAACACQPNSAYALAQNVDEYGEVPPPLPSLQVAFGGSLKGSFVEVAGPPGVGKTQFCLQAAASTSARGGAQFFFVFVLLCDFSSSATMTMIVLLQRCFHMSIYMFVSAWACGLMCARAHLGLGMQSSRPTVQLYCCDGVQTFVVTLFAVPLTPQHVVSESLNAI
nr:DNA repair protein RAD51-like protein 2 [Crypthecodinium cohnii]